MDSHIEHNPEALAAYANTNEFENEEFQFFLEVQDPYEIDERVYRLYEEMAAEIDCKACANCCKNQSPVLAETDLWNISEYLALDPETVKSEFIGFDGDAMVLKQHPCIFLQGNLCSIYEFRPADCRSYPHLHTRGIVFKLADIMGNYSICPIVFNVIELLKKETGFCL